MQILLSPELARIVEQNIASGAYSSPEAVIAAALLLLNEAESEPEAEAENQRRWQNFQVSGRIISHDTVKIWVHSLSTDNPLPCSK
ncbi:MAG: hypothetical protein ACKO7W_02505 [Elainella sp.]